MVPSKLAEPEPRASAVRLEQLLAAARSAPAVQQVASSQAQLALLPELAAAV
jgi:hypothetical protein